MTIRLGKKRSQPEGFGKETQDWIMVIRKCGDIRGREQACGGGSTGQYLISQRGIPMLQFIMDQNLLLYVCGAACVMGVISQFLLKHLYGKLILETQDTGEPKGKFMRQMQQRFKNCRHLNEKVNDISSFAERSMLDYEFLKMNLHQWNRMGKEALAVCLLSCSLGLWLLYRNGAAVTLQTSYSRAAILSTLLIGLAYGMTDNQYRHRSLKTRLMDYLENTGAVKEYQEVDFPEQESAGVQVSAGMQEAAAETASAISIGRRLRKKGPEPESKAQRDKRELKEHLGKNRQGFQEMAAAGEGTQREQSRSILQQMDPQEKEQILREVLREFL